MKQDRTAHVFTGIPRPVLGNVLFLYYNYYEHTNPTAFTQFVNHLYPDFPAYYIPSDRIKEIPLSVQVDALSIYDPELSYKRIAHLLNTTEHNVRYHLANNKKRTAKVTKAQNEARALYEEELLIKEYRAKYGWKTENQPEGVADMDDVRRYQKYERRND